MLEKVHKKPSINISVLSVPRLVKLNNFFGQYPKEAVFQNLYSLYIHVIRPKRRKYHEVFLPAQYSNFAPSFALLKNEVNIRGFSRYSVVASHKTSDFHSQSFLVDFT